MKNNILIFLFVFLISCGPYIDKWQSFPICVDTNNQDEIYVLEIYNESAGEQLFEVCEDQITVERVELIIGEDGDEKNGHAQKWFTAEGIQWCEIQILDTLSGAEHRSTFAHELGHCLGFEGHSDDENDLMFHASPTDNLQNHIDDFIVDWFLDYYGFDTESH